MSTKITIEKSNASHSKPQFFRLGVAVLITLLVAVGLVGGAWNRNGGSRIVDANSTGVYEKDPVRLKPKSDRFGTDGVFAQTQTETPTPSFIGLSDSPPPEHVASSSSNSAATSATPTQVYINFDVFPSGAAVQPGTPITNQYPPAIFSSDLFHYPIADNQFWNSSFPNLLGRAPTSGFYNGTGYAPLYVDFTSSVNNLKFYIVAVDEFRQGIAQINIFQNNRLAATRSIDGFGRVFLPTAVDVGGWGFDNVTRIEIVNINDYKGVGFDDFTFSVSPAPSPTPTPQPTPPTPTGLSASVTDRQVRLTWTGSTGADGYYVKRSTASGGPYDRLAALRDPSYLDLTPAGETTYFYVVSAFNNGGESGNSNQVTVSIPSACGDQPGITQSPGHIHSISGWDMTVEVSANDGVVLRDVSLNGRYMARSISIPYFTVQTSKTSDTLRGELKANSNDATLRSRLVKVDAFSDPSNIFQANTTTPSIIILAEYVIDRISSTSDSCLHVWQEYLFAGKDLTKQILGKPCEPSGTVPCAAFFPEVRYRFESRRDEVLLSFNAVQRNQFWVNALPSNGIGIFRDCDSPPPLDCKIEIDADEKRASAFKYKLNPLTTELKAPVIDRGQDTGQWDNIHQTFNERVFREPGFAPGRTSQYFFLAGGCPECLHMHWRWGKLLPNRADYGNGSVGLYYANSDQDMDIAIVKYKPLEQENAEPLNYASLANSESVRLSGEFADVPDQVLVYYSSTGYRQEDTFFRHLYFFNPDFGSGTRSVQNNPPATSANATVGTQDGPISVTFPHIYQDGSVLFTEIDPNVVAPLPQGYVAYNSVAYNITTEAEVSGPYVVSFGVPSATNQSVFDSLRILHAEPDPLDPDSGVWVDRTILAPDVQGPDFGAKAINAKVNNLAGFVIARLVQPQPPNTGTADLAVSTSSVPDPLVAPNNLTYTMTMNNAGPNAATGVGLIDTLSSDVEFVSASPNQGICKVSDGSVYCKLGSLNSGASTTVTIVVTPNEGGNRFPPEGQPVLNTAFVVANETDPNRDNNSFVKSNTVLPNPNAPPTVGITSPTLDARYVGPANLTVSANATDTDGAITQVNFYDNGTLIGSGAPAGSNQYNLAWSNVGFGNHSLVAIATDNGGRKNVSGPVNILVNGPASISINSPATGSVIAPHSNVMVTANVSIPSGVINRVDFFANSTLLGTVNGAGQQSVNWNDVPNGKYSLTAVATDGSGIATTSMPVSVVVSNAPTIDISTPQNGSSFGTSPVLTITANVQDDDSIIDKVSFFANGTLLGTGLRSGLNQFTFTWRGAPDGIYSLTAAAADQYGRTTTSSGITIGVNASTLRPGEFIWFDDDVPAGATKHADGDVDWFWVDANPGAFSGTKSHQSRNFGQLDLPNNSFHQHYFDGATTTLPIGTGDKLFTYVFLDINNMPREIMLQWKDASGWEHRAYWGANRIARGVDGTNSRRYMGPMPKAGQWMRLEVPASAVGLDGATLNGMAFSLDAGRATWDLAGKATANATQPPTTPPGDSVWIEDGLPAGAVTATVNDQWNWVSNPHYSGLGAHQSQVSVNHNTTIYRSHSFTGAQTPMQVNPGDVLFTYVYVDPSAIAQQIMVQWYDGTGWQHRAYWGRNFIGQQFGTLGLEGTESQRYMGGLPPAGSWYRLEVPASYVGLERKSVSGMAFSIYGKEPTVAWDRTGKSSQLSSVPLPLSATAGVWRLHNDTYGYAFETNDLGSTHHSATKSAPSFYAHPNQAAGTVPFYRFRRPASDNHEYFYSRSLSYDGNGWTVDVRGDASSNDKGIAFYVYENGSTPGTVPLYLYQNDHSHYILTTNQNEVTGASAVWAYVYPTGGTVPVAPRLNLLGGVGSCNLYWFDNPLNVTGFKIERREDGDVTWTQIATVGPEVTSYNACSSGSTQQGVAQQETSQAGGSPVIHYRMRATGLFGDSAYSNEVASCPGPICTDSGGPANSPPGLSIVRPATGDIVDLNFVITANAFDPDGAGTIVKVEFFANGNKLGEVTSAPYVFAWNNVAFGTYNLTATGTDDAGATTTSTPVNVTVDAAPSVSITSPVSGTVLNAPASITVNAFASDSDGSVSKVEFFQGPTKLGEDTTEPYSFDWNNVAAGSYVLTVVATDNLGRTTASSPVSITVNTVPTVSIIMPANGIVFTAPADITIGANASDGDGTISKVEFYQGTTLLGTDTTSPYNFTWNNVSAGSYSITAKATDNTGAVTSSIPISITVNALPNVSISSPTSGTSFAAPATVSINAVASDDGSISKVEFFKGATLIGTVTASPYNFSWNSVPVGSYSLTARATDNLGATVTSSAVSITVVNNPPRDWYWRFDEGSGMVVADSNGSGNQGTLINGTNWTTGKSGSALSFDGADDIVALSTSGLTDINNNFTLSFWVLPSASHEIDPETTGGYGGVSGQKYAFGPGWYDSGHAGAGVSVGTNGISVYEHAANYMPATLVYPTTITNWTHIAVVYENKQPKLYINGVLVRTGQTSPMNYVHVTPYYIGGMAYGHFAGVLDEVRIYNRFLSATEVSNVYNASNDLTLGKIVFASNRDGSAQIYSINQDGSSLFRLTSDAANNECPRWSPNNSRIVFQSDRDNLFSGAADIYVMNWDGSGQTRLTSDAYDDSAPVWSSDGTKIAFQSARNGVNYQVYVMNADGSGQVNVSNSTANDTQPSWSPDGTKIAFASDRDQPGFSSIYVMNANGSGQTRLTFSAIGFRDEQPSWSPNGMKLAFSTTRDSRVVTWEEWDGTGSGQAIVKSKLLINKEVYVMNADGSNQVRLTNTPENDDSPAWSGDGTKIAFRSDRARDCCDPVAQIWLMNVDGGNQLDLSNNGFGDYCPNWSR